MTFAQALENFATSLPGTDTYVRLRQDMQQLINQDKSAAAAYFLIAGFAKTYVMLYEDQEVNPEFAEESQTLLLSYLSLLNKAIKTGDKGELLTAMNKIVSDYDSSKKVF